MSSAANLKMLKDIDEYSKIHASDFKQVYFSPSSVSTSVTKKINTEPIKKIPGKHTKETCSYNASINGAAYFSLDPTESGLFNCDIYNNSKEPGSDPFRVIKPIWEKSIPADTSFVCLDMIGNLNAYDAKNRVVATIFKTQNPADKRTVPGRFHLVLLDNNEDKLQPLRIRKSKTKAAYVVVSVGSYNITKNTKWADPQNIIHSMSNETEQTGDRKISIDKITATKSLVSNDYKYKLSIINNKLVLETPIKDERQFYKTNIDKKIGKLYYASTYPEYKFLKEVPGSLQTLQSGNYTTYDEVYPDKNMQYDIRTGKCTDVCDAEVGCNAVYTVVDSVTKQTSCYIAKNSNSLFNAKPIGTKLESSTLYVKNPVINDISYGSVSYEPNGYSSEFAAYKPDGIIDASFVPGPKGAPYVQKLQKAIYASTFGKEKNAFTTIEGATTIVDDALNKFGNLNTGINQYINKQNDISNNSYYIKNKITNINRTYNDMSNNNTLYKFTSNPSESSVLSTEDALVQDNNIYMTEEKNLYTIAGLSIATLLVMAIII